MNRTGQMKMEAYEAPTVEVIEVAVEKGFAQSEVTVHGWGDGGSLGNYDVE